MTEEERKAARKARNHQYYVSHKDKWQGSAEKKPCANVAFYLPYIDDQGKALLKETFSAIEACKPLLALFPDTAECNTAGI